MPSMGTDLSKEQRSLSLSSICRQNSSRPVRDGFTEGEVGGENYNLMEAIIQRVGGGSVMDAHLHMGSDTGSLNINLKRSPENKSEEAIGSLGDYEPLKDSAGKKSEMEEVEEGTLKPNDESWQDRTNLPLVKMLWRQIENLAIREKEAEEQLNKERVEHLVAKVEEEVEFEGMVEDMCKRFRAEGEFMDMERREREWETERREVQLEEEVELLRSKVEALEEEIRIAHAEKEYSFQKKQGDMLDFFHTVQMQLQNGQGEGLDEDALVHKEENVLSVIRSRSEGPLGNAGETILTALQDMLSVAEERAQRERRALDDLEDKFHVEQQRWNDRERQFENQIQGLEKELNRMTDMLKDRESVISLERERRRQYGLEVDKTLAFSREEAAVHRQTCQKLKRLEDCLIRIGERAAELQAVSMEKAGMESQGKLSELVRELEKVTHDQQEEASPAKSHQTFEKECVERWKAQRDLLEDERDKLEEKISFLMNRARDNEKQMEKMWQDREKTLIEQLRTLETNCDNQETLWSKREAALFQERRMFELEIESYKKDWEEEKENLQAIIVDREQWMEEQSKEWACLLDAKEEELFSLKSLQRKLTDTLLVSRDRIAEIKKYLVRNRKGQAKGGSRLKAQKDRASIEDRVESYTAESDIDTGCSKELFTGERQRAEKSDDVPTPDMERLALDMETEIGKLTKEVRREQERLEKERTEVKLGTEQLKHERKELENKVLETLSLMEDLKGEIKAKEGQMEWERKQMENILTEKTCETEKLRAQLSAKEHEMEIHVQKYKDDVSLIEKEVEKERNERQEVMDLHFASRRKLIQEMKDNECRWEKEFKTLTHEAQVLREDILRRDEIIENLKREMDELVSQLEHERLMRNEELQIAKNSSLQFNKKDPHSKDLRERKPRKKMSGQQELEYNLCAEPGEEANENLSMTDLSRPGLLEIGLVNTENQTCIDRRDMEWQVAIEKIADFDKQIAEAMLAIQSLKEELSAKEKELQRARLERDSDSKKRETAWLQDQEQMKQLQEEHRQIEMHRAFEWTQREQALLREKEELLKLLEAERADTADAMSILQGAVRELQWALKHYRGKGDEDSSSDLERETVLDASNISTKTELVKVHASHLEEVDRFILDLKLKVEEAEKKARAAEVALAVNEAKKNARESRMSAALVQVGKEWRTTSLDDKGNRRIVAAGLDEQLPPFVARDWHGLESEIDGFQSPGRKHSKTGRGSGRRSDIVSTNQGLTSLQQERWPGMSDHGGGSWDAGVGSTGTERRLNNSASSWMTLRGVADDSYVTRDSPLHDSLALTVSTPPPRSQRRWLVDASWLDNVRKEQAILRHQLDLERQRVSVLGQVEAENRWMESAVVRALEQKRESDAKVLELQQKVAFLEAMITKRNIRERSPPSRSSTPFYKTTLQEKERLR